MEEKRSINKSLVVVSLLLLSVVAILIVMFVLRPSEKRDGIILPGPQGSLHHEQIIGVPSDSGFIQIDNDNVLVALETLKKPEYYHQVFRIQISSGKSTASKTIELWVNGPWIHAEVFDEHEKKSIFTDLNEAWIWYDSDLRPISVRLSEDILLEDLIGLPNFDYQTQMSQAERLECGYGYDEAEFLQYLYVTTQDTDQTASEYRFSLDSGLLCSCKTIEDDTCVYDVKQVAFERLVYGDQAFEGRFCLPDGTVPFTAETRMLQP